MSDTYEAAEAAMRRRWGLQHQHQEFTDTTQRYHDGEDVTPGDCWRACLASLLEVPLAEVPHFIHLYPDLPEDADPAELAAEARLAERHGARWWRESVAWVQEQRPGWTIASWDRPEPWTPFYNLDWAPELPASVTSSGIVPRLILTGPSPRGDWHHSVLVDAQTGELEHDPFPGGEGVLPGPGDRVALVREDWI